MDPLLQELLQDATTACNEATSVEQAVDSVGERICGFTGWSLERLYLSPKSPAGGTTDPDFPRAHRTIGGKNCYVLPVVLGSEVVAALEFFSDKPVQPDGQLLKTMRHIGEQLGRVFERNRVLKTRQKNAEEELSKSHDQLRALTAHLQSVREDERIKIARDLHDELGQVLTALKMDLALLNQRLRSSAKVPRAKLVKEITSMCGMVDRTIQAVQRIITELRPAVLDHLDFNDAIEWQTQEFQSRSGIACEFHSNLGTIKLERTTATTLFRIFQETITNVQWHSNASHVRIALEEKEGNLSLEVHDNGRGITEGEISDAKSFGILGLRERALLLGGKVHIFGAPGQGTTVKVQVPLVHRESHGR